MKNVLKRIIDLILAFILLFFLSPLILLVGVSVWLSIGFPIIFRQQRPGIYGIPFTIYKFRSMIDIRDESGDLMPDKYRLNFFCRFIRSTSLDELPEIINVIKGDMSFVGPRPLLMQYLERYTAEQARRHEVKPGITGWAQINGRNALTWEEKFKLDIWYVDNQSLWLDFKIIALTILKIIKREGINQPGQATAEEFNPQISRIKTDG
jgi:lipopolysaccharide/colanic/teichoic acid biosynthesis glycosyltransferase